MQAHESPVLRIVEWIDRRLTTRVLAGLTFLALVVLAAMFVTVVVVNGPSIVITGDQNRVSTREPAARVCPLDWVRTDGTDPETRQPFVVCTSPDGRYIMRLSGTGAPAAALDTQTGQWVPAENLPK